MKKVTLKIHRWSACLGMILTYLSSELTSSEINLKRERLALATHMVRAKKYNLASIEKLEQMYYKMLLQRERKRRSRILRLKQSLRRTKNYH